MPGFNADSIAARARSEQTGRRNEAGAVLFASACFAALADHQRAAHGQFVTGATVLPEVMIDTSDASTLRRRRCVGTESPVAEGSKSEEALRGAAADLVAPRAGQCIDARKAAGRIADRVRIVGAVHHAIVAENV